jgi:hypothetical protein
MVDRENRRAETRAGGPQPPAAGVVNTVNTPV